MTKTPRVPLTSPDKDTAKQPSDADSRSIATGLKSLYRTVIDEPIPDDLMNLLDSLDDLD